MQALTHHCSFLQEALQISLLDDHVRGSDDLLLIELPNVQLVHALHARDGLEVALDVVELEARGCGLQKDCTGALNEGDGGEGDHYGNEEGDGGVGVEALWRVSEPDDEGRDNNAEVVDNVAADVQEHAGYADVYASCGFGDEGGVDVGCVD